MHKVIRIEPEVMVVIDMFSKTTFSILIENHLFQVANEAFVKHIIIIERLLISHFGERIDNNTKDNIQTDDVNDDLESSIVA